MSDRENWFIDELERRGVSRREFLGFCTVMTSALALPASLSARVAKAIQQAEKPILVWLEFQDCAGNTESFLRASRPTVAEIVLDVLSIDYHETIMAAAGAQAEEALQKVVGDKKGQYLVVVEGSIPTFENGAYCTIGGRAAIDIAREVCGGAAATIAMGTCAAYGGIPAAAPNPTGALSVRDAVPGLKNLVNMPACPANAENMTALLVHYLTFKYWPPLDEYGRPLFAYGHLIHDNCDRRAHYEAGQYVEAWGDDGHRSGYCLYKMGCKGPVTSQNCPRIRWNEGTNWPIGCGHPCVGCAEPDFWDKMTPFYSHLPGPPFLGPGYTVDRVGVAASVGIAAAFATHGLISYVKRSREKPEPGPAKPQSTDSKKGDTV
jgi:hydrogenase small subunit